ncbi:MAG: AN1-type zinc finger domain-containing protein, partial [Candidatus Aenigmarchaeota archaeon]|nr:AN1-type zinc finger domain-containing protein [Candidatus Aenigmarchaeota archaeon]
MPFRCNFCGKYHDTKNRLPEDHNCKGLEKWKKERIKQFRRGEAPISY